jgi:hypothetical protein
MFTAVDREDNAESVAQLGASLQTCPMQGGLGLKIMQSPDCKSEYWKLHGRFRRKAV